MIFDGLLVFGISQGYDLHFLKISFIFNSELKSVILDATCALPTDLQNAAWEYNYTRVAINKDQSTILNISTTTLQDSAINLNAYGTEVKHWTCINSLKMSNTQTLVIFK